MSKRAVVLLPFLAGALSAGPAPPAWDALKGPEEAIAYIVFARPAETLETLAVYAGAIGGDPDAGEEVRTGIAGALQETLGFEPDLGRPIVLAAFDPTSRPDPIVAAAPSDPSAKPPEGVRPARGYWLWSGGPASLEGIASRFAGPGALPEGADVLIYLRVARIYPTLAPLVRMELGLLAAAAQGGEAGGVEIGLVQAFANELLDLIGQVDTVEAVLRLREDRIGFSKTMRAKPDTDLARFLDGNASAGTRLGRLLAPEAAFRLAANIPALWDVASKLKETGLKAIETSPADRKAVMKAYDPIFEALGGEIALSLEKGPSGKLRILFACGTEDAPALRDALEALAREGAVARVVGKVFGETRITYERDAVRIAGQPVDRLTFGLKGGAAEAVASALGAAPAELFAFPEGHCVAALGDGAEAALAAALTGLPAAKAAGPSGPPLALQVDLPTLIALSAGPGIGLDLAPFLEAAPPMTIGARFAPGAAIVEGGIPLANFTNIADAVRKAIEKGMTEAVEGPGSASGGLDAAVGKPAPDVKGKTVDGREVSLAALKGKVVILDFWATWCGPCRQEIPGFIALQKAYGPKGLAVLGVTDEPASRVKPFLEGQKINYTVIAGARDLAAPYDGIQSIPTTFVIDRSGKVVSVHVGYRDKEVFEGEIKPLLEAR